MKIRFKFWAVFPHANFLWRACVNFVFFIIQFSVFSALTYSGISIIMHTIETSGLNLSNSWSLSMYRKKYSLLWWFWISQWPITCTIHLENPAFLVHFSRNISTSIIRKERLCLTALNLKPRWSVCPLCPGVFSQPYWPVLFHCTGRWGEYKLPIVTAGQKVKQAFSERNLRPSTESGVVSSWPAYWIIRSVCTADGPPEVYLVLVAAAPRMLHIFLLR